MAKQTYIKKDLIDYVNGDVTGPENGYGGRAEWVEHNLPASASIQLWREGGYQGKLAFVIRLDGYVWVFNDYYGSCSGCDSFLSNERNYTEDMLRTAYCFPTEHAAFEYMGTTDDYSWKGVRERVGQMIEDRTYCLRNPKTRIEVTKTEDEDAMEITHQEPHQ